MKRLHGVFVAGCLLAGSLLVAGQAAADHPGAGPAFSDPGYTEALPQSWKKRPITYREAPADSDLVVTLDQHLYPALVPLIEDFARARRLKIAVQEGTCGISAGALLDKKVDIGGFCCPAGEIDRLPGLRFHTLGIAALALIAHPSNPVQGISLKEARDIFRGRTGEWAEVADGGRGRAGETIRPVARLHCKNRPGHWRLILADEDHFSPLIQEVSTIPDMMQRVASQPDAIGYETLWMTRLHNRHPVKVLRIDGVSAEDNQALVAGRYPFYRTYNITSWDSDETRKALAGELVRYIQQHFGSVDPKYGFIPSDTLRQAGWQFKDDELVGAP